MKLVVFCLLAVCWCSLADTSVRDLQKDKLQEVLIQLRIVKKTLQHSEQELSTPPKNIEDCCCLSALHCFRDKLQVHFNVKERKQRKLHQLQISLSSSLTEEGLNFCNAGNATSTCQDCDSHPKEKAKEFFGRLESLIERAITRLNIN